MDSEKSTEELLRVMLAIQRAGNQDASDCVADYANALAKRPVEALAAASDLYRSADSADQVVAATILGRVAECHAAAAPVVLTELERLLPQAADAEVRAAIACAFGWATTPRALPYLLLLAGDEDCDVRFYVALGLTRYLAVQEDAQALSALLLLTEDADDDVRDWATFGIGTQLDVDTP